MNMNRKVSICIFVLILIILIIVILEMAGEDRGTPLPETQTQVTQIETEPAVIANSNPIVNYQYIARIVDERIVIFESDGKTVYLETDIKANTLSAYIREQAQSGIGFLNEAGMFDFLESYSS